MHHSLSVDLLPTPVAPASPHDAGFTSGLNFAQTFLRSMLLMFKHFGISIVSFPKRNSLDTSPDGDVLSFRFRELTHICVLDSHITTVSPYMTAPPNTDFLLSSLLANDESAYAESSSPDLRLYISPKSRACAV